MIAEGGALGSPGNWNFEMSDTLNLAEAAEYLRLGYEATRELFERGELPGLSLNQKHVVFLRSELEAYIRETGRRQAAERRQGIKPAEHAATPRRARRSLPDLSAASERAPTAKA